MQLGDTLLAYTFNIYNIFIFFVISSIDPLVSFKHNKDLILFDWQ